VFLPLSLLFFPIALPPGIPGGPAPRTTPVDVQREAHGRLPPGAPPRATAPVIEVAVDLAVDEGPLELWRHSLGHGGINPLPLPDRVVRGTARLKPRLIRIFIQEFFQVYPEHGRFDWSRLDPYMDALARTGAKVIAAITIKPRPLFPTVDPAGRASRCRCRRKGGADRRAGVRAGVSFHASAPGSSRAGW
jgi:hypothetical protein